MRRLREEYLSQDRPSASSMATFHLRYGALLRESDSMGSDGLAIFVCRLQHHVSVLRPSGIHREMLPIVFQIAMVNDES